MGVTGLFLEHVEVFSVHYTLNPDKFTRLYQELMSPHGRFYLVVVKENNIPKIQQKMLEIYGLQNEVCHLFHVAVKTTEIPFDQIVLQRRAGREHLFVLRFFRSIVQLPPAG